MALKTKLGSEVPDGAVALSREEALAYQWNLIKRWPSEAEVLSLKFARHIVSATTLLSSFYVIKHFKNTLNVSGYRFLMILTPGIGVPSLISYTATDSLITNPALLMKKSCPLCDQLKFAASQFYLSLIFPATYGCISFSSFALFTKSYPFPDLKTNAREFWKAIFNVIKQGAPRFHLVGLTQTVLILLLPYAQHKQLFHIMSQASKESNKELYNSF